MTRFARAKGSKSSNERVPEQATSWQTMKEQLEQKKIDTVETKKRKEFEDKRKENYKAFLEEKQNNVTPQWAEFERPPLKNKNDKFAKKKKRKLEEEEDEDGDDDSELQGLISKIEEVLQKDEKKSKNNVKSKKRKSTDEDVNESEELCNVVGLQEEPAENNVKRRKKRKNNSNEVNLHEELAENNVKRKEKKKNNSNTVNLQEEPAENNVERKKKKKNNSNAVNLQEEPVENVKRKEKKKNNSNVVQENRSLEECTNGIDDDEDTPTEVSAKVKPTFTTTKPSKPAKKAPLKIPPVNTSEKNEVNDIHVPKREDQLTGEIDNKSMKIEKKLKKKIKKDDNKTGTNIPKPKKPVEEMTADELKRLNKKKEKRMRQLQNKKKRKEEERQKAALEEEQRLNQNVGKRKLPKPRDDKEHTRRKPGTQVKTMFINGVDVEIDYFDGFPIKKEDAERLRKLKKEMMDKGIPKSEIDVALKLERRKAEKALAREKKKVCFNCRRAGHLLSECPNLNESTQQEMNGTGICFKCGSTEHTHFECKVVRNDNFKYATCFICQQEGHISRQCPDNQKGLYPKGGACKVCGDVTHLKKDCPKFQTEQESQTIKLDTIDNNLERLPEEGRNKREKWDSNKKRNKIVKF